jgi:transcriptional regulator with XRE-family HTH domain
MQYPLLQGELRMTEHYKQTPIQQFIRAEMTRRNTTTIRAFAAAINIDKSTLSRIMRKTNPIEPTLDFLEDLAKATAVDIRVLVGLVKPNATFEDAHAAMLAHMIAKLPAQDRETIEALALGMLERNKVTS